MIDENLLNKMKYKAASLFELLDQNNTGGLYDGEYTIVGARRDGTEYTMYWSVSGTDSEFTVVEGTPTINGRGKR